MASNKQMKVAAKYSKALVRAMLSQAGSESPMTVINENLARSLESMSSILVEFSNAISDNKDTEQFFQNPTVSLSAKEKVLQGVLKSFDADKTLISFLAAVLKNGRISCLKEISSRFTNEVRGVLSVLAVKVTTARELPDSQKLEISKLMESRSDKKLEFDWHVNQAILGGIVLEYAGKKYDSSIFGALETLKEQLKF